MNDITYMTKAEIDSTKSIFRTCPCCHCEGFRHDEIAEYKGKEMCDECYIIAKQEEIGHLQLKVDRDDWMGWKCTREDYEPGNIIGMGKTIQAAIDHWLEQMEEEHGIFRKHLQDSYSWSGQETPKWWIEFATRKGLEVY
jgi:hypothetical protein